MNELAWQVILFIVCAVFIWVAGTKLEKYAGGISRHTGLGKALAGTLLLAVATSLPEVVTSTTATLIGNVDMAVHNLLGGVIIQTSILVFADFALRRGALTHFAPKFELLLQGVGLILILAMTISLLLASSFLPVQFVDLQISNLNFLLLPALYVLVLQAMRIYAKNPVWTSDFDRGREGADIVFPQPEERELDKDNLSSLWFKFAIASIVVMIAGWLLTLAADSIAAKTGLASSFVGATAVAFSTSLPEISTVFACLKSENFDMAIANIFGSNCFDVCLLALVALLSSTCVACEFSASATFAAAVGIFLTAVYLWGLLERRNKTIFGMGVDSIVVLFVTLGGFWVMYTMG